MQIAALLLVLLLSYIVNYMVHRSDRIQLMVKCTTEQ